MLQVQRRPNGKFIVLFYTLLSPTRSSHSHTYIQIAKRIQSPILCQIVRSFGSWLTDEINWVTFGKGPSWQFLFSGLRRTFVWVGTDGRREEGRLYGKELAQNWSQDQGSAGVMVWVDNSTGIELRTHTNSIAILTRCVIKMYKFSGRHFVFSHSYRTLPPAPIAIQIHEYTYLYTLPRQLLHNMLQSQQATPCRYLHYTKRWCWWRTHCHINNCSAGSDDVELL